MLGHVHNSEPLSDKPMEAEPIPITMAIEIKVHINSLEKKVEVASKKAIDQEMRLSKVQKVLVGANKEINHL